MPATGAIHPIHVPVTRHLSVFIAEKDVTTYVVMDTFELDDTAGDGAQGTFRCTLNRALSLLPELFANAWTRVHDHDAGIDIFRGFLKTYRPILSDGTTLRQTEIVATDHGELVDRFIPHKITRKAEADRHRIGYFWGQYGPNRLNPHLTYVQEIDASIPKVVYQGVTLRRVLDDIAAAAGLTVRWYIDQVGRLHYYVTEVNAAPKNICSDAPGAGEISVEDLEIDYDAGQYANRVWVQGGNTAGSGWVQDEAAIHKIGTTINAPDPLDHPHCKTAAHRNKIGAAYLARVTAGITRGSFTTHSNKATGWLSGQTLTVRSSSIGITADTRIVKVHTRVLKTDVREYSIEFGALKHAKAYHLPVRHPHRGLAGPAGAWSGTAAVDMSTRMSAPATDTDGSIADTSDIGDQRANVTDTIGTSRVQVGLLDSGDYGITVTSSDGSTVVIDGTSNMFKITATGTLTLAFPAAPGNSVTTVTLTALGAAFVTSPVMLSQMTLVSGGVTDARYGHFIADITAAGAVNYHAHNNIHLDASPGQAVVGLQTFSNLSNPGTTAAVRYYVMVEAGI